MSIRYAQVEDALEIKQLVTGLSHFYLENPTHALPAWFAETLEKAAFEQRLSSTQFVNLVYVNHTGIVGYLSIKGGDHLYHLFVAASEQGKGIASALWREARTLIGFERCTLRSSLYAIPVYERFGFKMAGAAANKDGIGFQPMEWRRELVAMP